MRSYWCLATIILVAVAGLVIWSFAPPYGEICKPDEYTHAKECATYHMLLVWLWHLVKFLNDYGLAFTALFTLAVAVFTWLIYSEALERGKKDLRAYLGIPEAILRPLPKTFLRADVKISNSGKTPARRVRTRIHGELRLPEEVRPFSTPDPNPGVQSIAPGSHWTIGFEFLKLTEADMLDVINQKKWAYVWGRVDYADIYGNDQWIEFRYRNVVREMRFGKDGPEGVEKFWFWPETEGNDAT